ncbi:two-component system response regulator [Clostridia bacterium]|nr:two-component system response regulator [Clostridia bacterium]
MEEKTAKNSVLIVDDNKQNVEALRSILEGLYTVYVALNGQAALRTMRRTHPDIVLLDVIMPEMDGFEVMTEMRKDSDLEKTPVIFISGEKDEVTESRGLSMGAFDYIIKPYNPEIVQIKVRNQLDNRNYRTNLEDMVAEQTKELVASREAIIMGMSILAETRDQGTGKHVLRVKKYSEILSWHIQATNPDLLPEEELQNIVLYSPLHDVGKVGIPDAVLLKPGKLTDEEFGIIKSHTVFGGNVLRQTESFLNEGNNSLRVAIEIAESHHEKWNGKGYPHGKKGTEIPISARIVAIADIYDALTSKREYKDAMKHDTAYDIIVNGDGRTMPDHFDPDVLEAFKNVSFAFKNLEV